MAHEFYREAEGIWRLRVPFERIYTSVFLVVEGQRRILVDCATTDADVDEVILPALRALGIEPAQLDTLVLTHHHADHAGGLERLLRHAPAMEVVREVRSLTDTLQIYPMAGHTADCIGLLDQRTHTLISGDGLQGAGVDKYRCYTKEPQAYLETVKRVWEDGRIENILFSHAYEPWNCDAVRGRSALEDCLRACLEYKKDKT